MHSARETVLEGFQWLADMGVSRDDLLNLNPCVPGEFTAPNALYVNSGGAGMMFRGTNEGSLPLVAGIWFLIPTDIVKRHPNLRHDAMSVARAPRLIA